MQNQNVKAAIRQAQSLLMEELDFLSTASGSDERCSRARLNHFVTNYFRWKSYEAAAQGIEAALSRGDLAQATLYADRISQGIRKNYELKITVTEGRPAKGANEAPADTAAYLNSCYAEAFGQLAEFIQAQLKRKGPMPAKAMKQARELHHTALGAGWCAKLHSTAGRKKEVAP